MGRNLENDMSLFRPITSRLLAEYLTRACREWDSMAEDRDQRVNPDEPIVLSVPNPEWDGDRENYCDEQDDEGNERNQYFHVESYGSGAELDNEGVDCGHDGLLLTGMEICQEQFSFTGRRLGKDA